MARRAALWAVAAVAAGAVVVAVGGCSSPAPTGPTTVTVVMSVCHHTSCFTAPVPDATVHAVAGSQTLSFPTDETGTATVTTDTFGPAVITAEWGGLEAGPIEVMLGNGPQSVTMGIPDIAKVAG